MKNGLDGMIRLHKWQLDEKRRQATELEVMREDLCTKLRRLEDELAKEQEKVKNSQIIDISYANYAANVMSRRENIEQSITEVDTSIEAMKDELAESFKELKKFEIVEQRARDRARHEENRRNQEELDEVAINMHRRNKNRHA